DEIGVVGNTFGVTDGAGERLYRTRRIDGGCRRSTQIVVNRGYARVEHQDVERRAVVRGGHRVRKGCERQAGLGVLAAGVGVGIGGGRRLTCEIPQRLEIDLRHRVAPARAGILRDAGLLEIAVVAVGAEIGAVAVVVAPDTHVVQRIHNTRRGRGGAGGAR